MSTINDEPIWVANSEILRDGSYLTMDVSYTGEIISVIVFRYKGECFAYRNLCVHMPRKLDCMEDMIFDESGQYLRCSMHGIVYDPGTGISASEICHGERLTSIEVTENDQGVWIIDKRVQKLASTGQS